VALALGPAETRTQGRTLNSSAFLLPSAIIKIAAKEFGGWTILDHEDKPERTWTTDELGSLTTNSGHPTVKGDSPSQATRARMRKESATARGGAEPYKTFAGGHPSNQVGSEATTRTIRSSWIVCFSRHTQYRRNSSVGTRNLSQEVPQPMSRILSSRYDSLLQKGFTGHLQHLPELFLRRIFAVETHEQSALLDDSDFDPFSDQSEHIVRIQSAVSSPGAVSNRISRIASARHPAPFLRPPCAGSTRWHHPQSGSRRLPPLTGASLRSRTTHRECSAGIYWPGAD
jgi:hypothetical protein